MSPLIKKKDMFGVCVSKVRSQGKKEEVPIQYVLRKTKG
jgi:hypothetical protein